MAERSRSRLKPPHLPFPVSWVTNHFMTIRVNHRYRTTHSLVIAGVVMLVCKHALTDTEN